MKQKRVGSVTGLASPVERGAWNGVLTEKLGTSRIDGSSDWEVKALRRRLFAGMWSGRLALVLSVPFALTAWVTGAEHAWFMYMLLPVVAAFFSGSLFGAAICKRAQVPDESLAGRRGALVALGAYIIYALEVAAMSVTPFESGLNAFMGSLLVSGWVVFPAAFCAGIMAFRAHEGTRRYRRAPDVGSAQ